MNRFMRSLCHGLMVLAMLVAVAALQPARADQLDDLRAAGALGEANTGYLVVRSGGGAAKAVADKVNSQRRAIYAKRASEEGVPVDQVGKLYLPLILQKAPPGTWYQDASGQWKQK
jgi:uncharacterized protein YdbL (DUF1318 family)